MVSGAVVRELAATHKNLKYQFQHLNFKKMKNSKKIKEYSLEKFMKMKLPENSKLIDKKLGSNFVGPFSKRLRRLTASYNVHFPELEPAFRKLDLILASGDKELVEAALRIDDLTIDNLIKNNAVELLLEPKDEIRKKDVYLLTNDAGWETWPHESERIASQLGSESETNERKTQVRHAAFTECHETVGEEYNIWIPEFVEVFKQIDKLLVGAR